MSRRSTRSDLWIHSGVLMLAIGWPAKLSADAPVNRVNHGQSPVYQRRAFEWMHEQGGRRGRNHDRGPVWVPPQVSAGWFQRPYPYHLDYYRMRYGGSYAPYFGNLYGPPQVVTAPPYYGPYYGGYDVPNGYFPPGYGNGAVHAELPPLGASQLPASEAEDGTQTPLSP